MKIILVLLSLTLVSYSHSGRLDHKGGHTNKSNGKYHLHTKKKGKSTNSLDTTIRIQILKWNGPYGWGKSFSSIDRCEREIANLAKVNAGLDYSYVCAIK